MDERERVEFKFAGKALLRLYGINDLRAYGRRLQLTAPSKLNKRELIDMIIKVLCGELQQERVKRGAPIKMDHVNPKLLQDMLRLKRKYHVEADMEEDEIDEIEDAAKEKVVSVSREEPIAEEKTPADALVLRFSVRPALLNPLQQQLLFEFINSLKYTV